MGLKFDNDEGQTPLEEEEREGLLLPFITTRAELDEFEQQNIEDALQWVMGTSFKVETLLSVDFIKKLHYRMYKEVWSWAGKFRLSNKNIGINARSISTELKKLMDDANFWYEHSIYPPDEFALRFKHRLVSIHCFPNGNGRHSRMMADLILEKIFHRQPFSWGAVKLSDDSLMRKKYIQALKSADQGDYKLLLKFARS